MIKWWSRSKLVLYGSQHLDLTWSHLSHLSLVLSSLMLSSSNLDSMTFSRLQAEHPVLYLCIEFHINFTLFSPFLKERTKCQQHYEKQCVCVCVYENTHIYKKKRKCMCKYYIYIWIENAEFNSGIWKQIVIAYGLMRILKRVEIILQYNNKLVALSLH